MEKELSDFRDYLNEHPQIAKEYETLKLELWKRYEHDRDAYIIAKLILFGNGQQKPVRYMEKILINPNLTNESKV